MRQREAKRSNRAKEAAKGEKRCCRYAVGLANHVPVVGLSKRPLYSIGLNQIMPHTTSPHQG